jgi:hypothetical protein
MRTAVLVATGILALAGLTPQAAFQETEHITKTLSLDSGGTLRLKSFSGRVSIAASDRSEVAVDAVRHGSRSRLDEIKLDIYKDGNTVNVDANRRQSRSWWRRHDDVVETDFDIKVPRRTDIDVTVFSAPVTVRGVEGSHTVHTFSARVVLDDVAGPIRAHSFNGPIEIRASRWSGDESIDADTFSGDIDVRLPAGARGSVSFNSFSGHIDSDIPLTLRSSSRRHFQAELGGGGDGRLRFKTFSGSVRINR